MDMGRQTLKLLSHSENYNSWLFRKVKPYLGKEILEVGGGIGTFTEMLLADNREVTVMEIKKDYLRGLKKRFSNEKLELIQGDIQKLSLKGFDTVFCFNVLEHLDDDKKGLKNIHDSLKKRGILLLLVPAHQRLFSSLDQNLRHHRRYNKEQISTLLKNTGFRIKKISYLNILGAIGWLVNSRVFKRKVLPSRQLFIFDKISLPFLFLEKFLSPPFGLSILAIAEKR